MVTSTLINGNRPSFVSIALTVDGQAQPAGAFLSIDYAVSQEPGLIFSKSRADLVGSTPGYAKATGTFEILVSESNDLFGSLTGDGAYALTTPTFNMTVSYSSNAIDVQTDKLIGCRVIGVSSSNKGTTATTKTVNFIFGQLVVDGVVIGGDTSVVGSNGLALAGKTPIATDFWYSPVYADANGDWACPGFTGNTYSPNPWDAVFVAIPYSGTDQPLTPGICEVLCEKERSFDKKKAKGADGARITVHGIDAAEGEIEIVIWTPQQYRVLMEMWPLLFPPPQKFTTTKTVTTGSTTQVGGAGFGSLAAGNNEPTGFDNGQFGPVEGTTAQVPQTFQTKRISTTQVKSESRPFDVSHPKFKLLDIKSVIFVKGSGPDPGPTPFSRVFKIRWVEYYAPGSVDVTTTPAASKSSTFEPVGYQTPGSNPSNSNLVG